MEGRRKYRILEHEKERKKIRKEENKKKKDKRTFSRALNLEAVCNKKSILEYPSRCPSF